MAPNRPQSTASQTRVGVIGGGALGLAAALRLAQGGARVTVIERESNLGGLAAGFRPGADSVATLERFYHHLFRTDHAAIRFIQELGLAERLVWRTPITATLRGGRVYPMSPIGVLGFSPIPLLDRIRLMAALGVLKLIPNERLFAGQTAAAWSKRWVGPRGYGALLGPLLSGKFGARAPEIAMGWLWSRFHERSLSLGYIEGGFQQFYDALGERIRALGGETLLGVNVTSIEATNSGVSVATDSQTYGFDRLLVTVPQRAFAQMAPELNQDFFQRFPGPDFYSAHVLILALDRPLSGQYWINIADPGYPFLVLVEHTNFMPADQYGGRHLVYLGNYLPSDANLFRQSDEEVLDAYLPALARLNPAFDRSWVKAHWMFQAPNAQPIVTEDYLRCLAPHRTPLPGVYYATMAHVYPQDRGQNYSLLLGERLATMILADLSVRAAPSVV